MFGPDGASARAMATPRSTSTVFATAHRINITSHHITSGRRAVGPGLPGREDDSATATRAVVFGEGPRALTDFRVFLPRAKNFLLPERGN